MTAVEYFSRDIVVESQSDVFIFTLIPTHYFSAFCLPCRALKKVCKDSNYRFVVIALTMISHRFRDDVVFLCAHCPCDLL